VTVCGCICQVGELGSTQFFLFPANFFSGHKGVRICALSDIECTANSVIILRNQIVDQERDKGGYDTSYCNCWPACTTISYEVETNQVSLSQDSTKVLNETDDENDEVLLTRVSFLFKEAQFFASKRSELFGQTDFFANCGGLLGLFMGVSLLSIVEIVYFFSIRLLCTWRRSRMQF
jgi:acid-sensing ion channel, other